MVIISFIKRQLNFWIKSSDYPIYVIKSILQKDKILLSL